MMGNEGISVADALALRGNYEGGSGFGGFGGDGWWIIVLILLFGVGGGGYGRGWGGNGGGTGTPASTLDLADAFNFNQLDNGLRGIEQGICNGFYTSAQQINSVLAALQSCCCETRMDMMQGFNGVNQGLNTLGYNVQAGFNTIGNQIASCCCDIGRGQDGIKYELATVANNLMVAGDKNTDRIINYLTQTEMDKLRTELQSAQFQLSQLSQTDNIINRLMPVAKPAYITCSPYAAAFGFGANQNGYGCGCC